MSNGDKCVSAILGVILPPIEVFRHHKCAAEFWIDLVLTLLLFWCGGIFYCFHLKKVECVQNILCLLIPPLGVYLKTKDIVKTLITLILWFFGILPGVIIAYFYVQ